MIAPSSESLRAQLELPLAKRRIPFAVVSVFVLLPLSVVWSLFAFLRSLLRGKRKDSLPDVVRVVSVGNVSVGGTGKSPVVRSVARMAFNGGYDVAIITRGYAPSGPAARVIARIHDSLFAESEGKVTLLSDETLEHAIQLQSYVNESNSLWICQGKNRQWLFETLVEQWRACVSSHQSGPPRKLAVILDDGLQQTALPVHRDVIVWSPETVQQAPQMCLPYGPYRMGFPVRFFWNWAIPAGDVVVWSRLRSRDEQSAFHELATTAAQKLGIQTARGAPTALSCIENRELAQICESHGFGFKLLRDVAGSKLPERVHLLCGIARPERFMASVERFIRDRGLSVEIESCLAVSDHGAISQEVLKLLASGATLITTLKDVSRWWQVVEVKKAIQSGCLFVMCLEVDLMNAEFKELNVSFDELFQFQ